MTFNTRKDKYAFPILKISQKTIAGVAKPGQRRKVEGLVL